MVSFDVVVVVFVAAVILAWNVPALLVFLMERRYSRAITSALYIIVFVLLVVGQWNLNVPRGALNGGRATHHAVARIAPVLAGGVLALLCYRERRRRRWF